MGDIMIHPRTRKSGFTLVELLIAMSILSLGLFAAVSMHFGSARNNSKGHIYTQANMLARTQLEILKNLDVANLTVGGPYQDPNNPIASDGQPGGIYNRSWRISILGVDARSITVTVQWQRLGRTNSVEISSNTKGNGV
jgi:prepilin-type N-terminal cleavage/methylation domain-containing protein